MSWRNTKEYRNWKYECIRLSDGKCSLTGATTNLHVHHIDHATYYPEKRYDVDNGFVLHRSLHYIFHYLMMGGSRKKCTSKDLIRFKRLFKFIRIASKIMNL